MIAMDTERVPLYGSTAAMDIKSNQIPLKHLEREREREREAGRTVGHTLMIKLLAGGGFAAVH